MRSKKEDEGGEGILAGRERLKSVPEDGDRPRHHVLDASRSEVSGCPVCLFTSCPAPRCPE